MNLTELKHNHTVEHLIADINQHADWLQFFLMFARMEYALKQSGYVTTYSRNIRPPRDTTFDETHGPHQAAMPDWRKFIREISPYLKDHADARFLNAAETLKTNPPYKQGVSPRGELYWFKPNYGSGNEVLVNIIKTVRNNLFHGGKYPTMPVHDPSRDIELIENCVIVLETFIASCPRVHEHYFDELE